MQGYSVCVTFLMVGCGLSMAPALADNYPVVDTGQTRCFDEAGYAIVCAGSLQDGDFPGRVPRYQDQGDGSVLDRVTGLLWQRGTDRNGDGAIDSADKLTQPEAADYCDRLTLAGRDDWRLPDIKTLYSLILFSGRDPSSGVDDVDSLRPFLDTVFAFGYGDTQAGERIIDAQYASSSLYAGISSSLGQDASGLPSQRPGVGPPPRFGGPGNPPVTGGPEDGGKMFGVNFADGRIKGYDLQLAGTEKTFYFQCVSGDAEYGQNRLTDNGDATLTDEATGLMWQQADSQVSLGWQAALDYCDRATTAGYRDWRLPDAKQLQSIVDYRRAPDATDSAALDARFQASERLNEAGERDWGYYWSSTTHASTAEPAGGFAAYLAFGRALGYMNGQWRDVHGAGAQRSDPKTLQGPLIDSMQRVDSEIGPVLVHGPQGDVVRGANFARCVRDAY